MKFNFKKVSAIASSLLLTGMTMGVAAAANYPAPFVSGSSADVAVVYGASASPLDVTEAGNIQLDLQDALPSGAVSVSGGSGVTEDEIVLGGSIVSGDIDAELLQKNLPSLLDEKISWDDGDGSEDYDVHEEIRIDGVDIITRLDQQNLDEVVAMSNQKGLEYCFVFEDALNITLVGDDEADALYLDILGKSYEIESMEADSITVVVAEEYSLKIGESVTVDGKTFTVDDIFDGKVQVNGEMIDEDQSKKIDGMRVAVDTVGYHSNAPELSKCILRIGEDLSKTYESGDEYIGEDEDEPIWTWAITDLDQADGSICVTYAINTDDANDDVNGETIKYIGDSYVFPENFAAVTFEGLTDVDSEEVKIFFDDSVDLYSDNDSADPEILFDNEPVLVIKAPSEAITVDTDEWDVVETSEVVFFLNNVTEEMYFKDDDGDLSPTSKYRFASDSVLEGNITVEDTVIAFVFDGATLDLTLPSTGEVLSVAVNESYEFFGVELEDAESTDLLVDADEVGTRDDDVMTDYGVIIKDPEANLDNDEVVLSVPEEQVYAEVSVTAGGEVSSTAGVMVVTDSEASSVSGKNLIVVGGSCINSVAASIVGGSLCGSSFTGATGVGAGQFLIQSVASPLDSSKVAVLVAGYEAADTQAASAYLRTQTVDTTVGKKGIGTTGVAGTITFE